MSKNKNKQKTMKEKKFDQKQLKNVSIFNLDAY